SPGKRPLLRIHGELLSLNEFDLLNADTTKCLIEKSMSDAQLKEFKTEWELDYAIQLSDLSRFRVNAFHQTMGISAVFRFIPDTIPSFTQLGLPDVFKKLLNLSGGLIVVTGATGSGKTTTLAAMIHYINTHFSSHIITLED